LNILKRNGQAMEYDGSKIVLAIEKAMADIGEVNALIANDIEEDLFQEIENSDEIWMVEEISDRIEQLLMSKGNYDIAKSFILYRSKRTEERKTEDLEEWKYKLLTKEFLSKYKHRPNPFPTQLGEFVYYRTYSRFLPDKKRREFWWETVARAVDYNCSLQPSTTKQEAEELFDNMYNLKQFLSGRTLWSGGTKTGYTNPISQFNCSGIAIDNFDAYKDICYLLMLGCGVGLTAEKKHTQKLPKVRGDIQIIHQFYSPVNKKSRKEATEFNTTADVMEIIVGDSKLAWSNAVDLLIKVFYSIDYSHINFIMINYNNVRPHGEALKTFGGTASGHEALQTILDKTSKVLLKDNKGYKKLKPIDAMDIANIIAEGIVVGGVRRSAEMVFMDSNDQEMMNAKKDLYTQDASGNWIVNQDILHRMMSNNSVAYYEKPSFEDLKNRFKIIRHSAEGNFYNMEAAMKRKPNCKISNPCGKFCLK